MFLVVDEAFRYLSIQCFFTACFKRGHPDKKNLSPFIRCCSFICWLFNKEVNKG